MSIDDLVQSLEPLRREAALKTAARRAELPLRYLRQQAHLTAPASDLKLAEKALADAGAVARRLLDRYALEPAQIAERLELPEATVAAVVAAGRAPAVVLDLEDGVPPQLVAEARANAVRLARDVDRGDTLCLFRPVGITDPRCTEDIASILLEAAHGRAADAFPIDGIVVPKVRHVHEVEWVGRVLSEVERTVGLSQNQIRTWFQVETGWGVLNLPDLALAGLDRLAGIILGTVDLSADLLLPEVRYRHPIAEWARMMIVTVAGAAGVQAIDGMTIDFPVGRSDLDAAQNHDLVLDRMEANFEDALHSIDAGMAGRWVGHPLQLTATLLAFHKAFTSDAIQGHVDTVEEFARAMSSDKGAVAGASGQLLDIGTDRHVRQMLRRATAWGLLERDRARELGVISDAEMGAER